MERMIIQTMCAREGHLEAIRSAHVKLQNKYSKLQDDFGAAIAAGQEVEDKLQAVLEEDVNHLHICDWTRGKPMGFHFVRHCGTLLATGGSARSVRKQLLLNTGFVLEDKDYETFGNELPSLRWFQYQCEGMGLESLVYTTLTQLAKCECVEQLGFDQGKRRV
jgi:hypothetical protein